MTCAPAVDVRTSSATRPLKTDKEYVAEMLRRNRAHGDACAFDDVSFWRAIGARS